MFFPQPCPLYSFLVVLTSLLISAVDTCICFNSNLIEIQPLYSTFNQACMLKPGLSLLVSLQLCCYFSYPETTLLNQCLLSEPDRRCCFQFISWEENACSRIAAALPMPLHNSQPLRGITTSNTQLVKSWLY